MVHGNGRPSSDGSSADGVVQRLRLLDLATTHAALTFMRHIEVHYTPVYALVYGSRARGTHRPESDADIAVILKGKRGDRSQIGMDMAGIAVDVLMRPESLSPPSPCGRPS